MTLSPLDFYGQIAHFFWPTVRVLSVFGAAPIFNEKGIQKKAKIALALLISFLITPNLPDINVEIFSMNGLWVGARELMIGAAIGLSVQLLFVAVRTAGEIIGLQMGLSFATFFDPSSDGSMPVISRILNLLVTLLFLSFNGHLWMIDILADSFRVLPVSAAPLRVDTLLMLVEHAGMIFKFGIMLGLPIITLLLSINLTLGLLNRLTPQLSIFVIGFPLTLTVGMSALLLMMYTLSPWFENMMADDFDFVSKLIYQLS